MSTFHSRFFYFQLIKLSKEAIAWCSTLDLNLRARERCPECVECFDYRRKRLTFSLIDSNICFILNKVLSHPYVGVGRRRRNGAAEKSRCFLSISQRVFNFISPLFLFLKTRWENKLPFGQKAFLIFLTGKIHPFQKAEAVLLFFRGSKSKTGEGKVGPKKWQFLLLVQKLPPFGLFSPVLGEKSFRLGKIGSFRRRPSAAAVLLQHKN